MSAPKKIFSTALGLFLAALLAAGTAQAPRQAHSAEGDTIAVATFNI